MNRNQPSFYRFPQQNNRTGWHPVWAPTILVIPWSRDYSGRPVQNSGVIELTFSIEKNSISPIAGHDHVGMYNPDYNLYKLTIKFATLPLINTDNCTFYDTNGNIIDKSHDPINKTIAENAFKLVGKIKTQGKHAGGLIISSKPHLYQWRGGI